MKKINLKPKNLNVSVMLTIALLLLIAYEAWLGYNHLYLALFTEPVITTSDNVIRVDLASYQNTVDLLNGLRSYRPDPEFLSNSNPFR